MTNILKQQVQGSVLISGDEGYETQRKIWNAAVDKWPGIIVVCKEEADAVCAVRYAREHNLEISIKGGGHHVAGTAVTEGGIMIDLSELTEVVVDENSRIARVQGGATLADIDRETQRYGLATPTGTVSETGVAGLALNGGLGYLRAKYGLTCDNIQAVNLVTADGDHIRVSDTEHPDLFWAIRGGGGNFGVVTSFEFQLHEIGPEVLALDVMYDFEDVKTVFHNLNTYLEAASDEISVNATLIDLPPAPFIPEFLHHRRVIIVAGIYAGSPEEGEPIIQPLRELAQPLADMTAVMPYVELQKKLDAMVPQNANIAGTSLYLEELTEEALDQIVAQMNGAPAPAMVQLWETHGHMNRIPTNENAYYVRGGQYLLLVDVIYEDGQDQKAKEWIDEMRQSLLVYSYEQTSYLNLTENDESIIRESYGSNYARLVAIKQKYDPNNIFHVNHNIDPKSDCELVTE
ncbi:FAD-linked oxidase [Pontibacillus chungwhensis BH030062]|uniref:FAD-linked oxidase n=1 Tax=Pontibacillus chungwhensis BH030062 TaxID=1385513 RepID=A0A0A2V0T8_9BACI|nr:FAD-binding oxidoreductase [Pontibacillus chungwhensis]KGP92658.1 FAD-linked oxidase [Pontibacillus chungwhensis BH030062]